MEVLDVDVGVRQVFHASMDIVVLGLDYDCRALDRLFDHQLASCKLSGCLPLSSVKVGEVWELCDIFQFAL